MQKMLSTPVEPSMISCSFYLFHPSIYILEDLSHARHISIDTVLLRFEN